VVQAKDDLQAGVASLDRRLETGLRLMLTRTRARVEAAAAHRVFAAEKGRLQVKAQGVDELTRRAERALLSRLEQGQQRSRRLQERVDAFRWDRQVAARRERLAHHLDRLQALLRRTVDHRRATLGRLAGQMGALSPLAVLGRGYALAWDETSGALLRDAAETEEGRRLRIRLHRGALGATVDSRELE
jgi:exodeoxyribonuclease VII large subunit